MIQALWSLDQQFQNKNGSILTHGKIYVYYSGRTALATTYSDEDGTVVNPNPIILDNNGRAACFASSMYSYTVVVCDAYGKELFSYDITLHDAVATAEKVFVIGTDGTVQVDTTTLPNGVQYDLSVNTDIIATNELVENVSANIQEQLDNKKDVQEEKSYSGSQTKTITNITQDENGVITVTYEDIDLPPEVPNVEIVSPNGTLSVSATTDQATNTKTFSIDVNNDQMQSFIGYYGKSQYEYRPSDTRAAYTMPIGKWSSYTYNGDFITNDWDSSEDNVSFLLKPGLYLVHAVVMYQMNESESKKNDAGYIRVATGTRNGWEDGTRYKDWSSEYQEGHECSITVSFIRRITAEERNNTVYIAPYLPYGVNFACIHELQIVKLDSVVGQGGGGGGTTYTAGDAIDLTNDEISVKYGNGLTVNGSNELEVKVGEGLMIDPVSGVVMIDTEVGDVVETVEKLKKDLDTQITTNFDMPNISQVYDFADPSVSTLANGACMLCQSFTIPINHEIRTVSEDADEPTLFGIYAQQGFGHKIMLALYEYTYAKAGEEHGSSTYVGDTGPVDVLQGVNEYPLKNRNPSITELRSDKVYYATLYLPNAARVNGLMLAGAPNYGNQSVPAEPRLSCAVENITWNNQELDMSDPTTTLNHYQTYTLDDVTYYNYYIGPWNSGYNERWTAPRFYMQIRNGEYNEPVIPTAPFVDLGNVLPTGADQVSNLPGFTASASNSSFRDVTPLTNVTITSFEWVDDMANVAGWAAANCVYDSGFATNLSGNSNTTTDLGSVGTVDGHTMYAHRITFTTPISLTANTTYRFLCECFESSSSYIFGWTTPTSVVHVGNNGWYVVNQNLTRYDNIIGKYNKLTDSNNNSYVI